MEVQEYQVLLRLGVEAGKTIDRTRPTVYILAAQERVLAAVGGSRRELEVEVEARAHMGRRLSVCPPAEAGRRSRIDPARYRQGIQQPWKGSQ